MELMQSLHFLRPAWLLILPLAWGMVGWLARSRRRGGEWQGVIDAELLPLLQLDTGAGGATPWPWLLLLWTLAGLALAGPSWQRETVPGFRAPANWVLVLDLSPSMAAGDVAPDRAGRARYAIDDLLTAARDGRVALIAFGEEPYDVTPLTDDVATVRTLLPPLAPSLLPVAGDRLAPALAEAGKLLRQAGAGSGQVVVLTDGFADPAAAFTAASTLRQQGVAVNVVGIGTTAGAPLPDAAGRFVRAGQGGGLRLARLDTDLLQRLADAGGGLYSPLSGLSALASRLQAPGATAQIPGEKSVAHWRDAGIWLLPLIVLVAAGLSRRGWFS